MLRAIQGLGKGAIVFACLAILEVTAEAWVVSGETQNTAYALKESCEGALHGIKK